MWFDTFGLMVGRNKYCFPPLRHLQWRCWDSDTFLSSSTMHPQVELSRGAVPTVATMKRTVIRAALAGYNRIFLYMEDTFKLENEVFFGCVPVCYVLL